MTGTSISMLVALSLTGTLLQSPPEPPRAAVISGRVLEADSLTPIPGAQVMATAETPAGFAPAGPAFLGGIPAQVTGKDGRYQFDGLAAGRYRITVQKTGFARPGGRTAPDVRLRAGEHRADVDLVLQKAAVIVGHVVDESGEPLLNVNVMAMQQASAFGAGPALAARLMPAGPSAQTNDLGEFRLFGLTPGEYYVHATPNRGFNIATAPGGITLLPTYFPGTADAASAQPIAVGPGQTSGDIVIRLVGTPAFQISGTVIDRSRRPVASAMVQLIADEPSARPLFVGSPWNQTYTDANGRFTLHEVTNGAYSLLASVPVISGPGGAGAVAGGAPMAGGGAFGFSGGIVGGTVGGGVTTHSANGTTIQYRDDTATRVAITVNGAGVTGLEIVAQPPAR
jgi:protocatechuate 3,4-dioxygenase beta subunit